MIGNPTTDEMSAALVEFHQRNQGLIKPVDPPSPFQITSTVVQHQPTLRLSRQEEDPPPDVDQQAMVQPETQFEFIPIALFGTVSFIIQLWFKCHNEGTIGEESYIRLYPGSYWRSVDPPGLSGIVDIAFAGSTWVPAPHDEQGTFVQLWATARVPLTYINAAHMYFAVYIQGVASPYRVSDAIYPIGQVPNWAWYNANNGVGFDILFHTAPG